MKKIKFLICVCSVISIMVSPNFQAQNALTLTNSDLKLVGSGNVNIVLNNFDLINNSSSSAISGTGVFVFNGGLVSVIEGSYSSNLYGVQISKSSLIDVTLNKDLTVTNCIVNSGIFNLNNKTLNVKGDFTNNSTISNLGEVIFSGSGAQAIGGSTITSFNDLTINGGSGTTTLSQNINVGNVLTVSLGKTLNATDKIINLTATGTPFANSGTFTAGTSTVHYNNAGATSMAALTYHNLQSTGAATKTLLGNVTVSNQLSLDGTTLDIESNKLTLGGSVASSPSVSNGAEVDAQDGEIELTNAASVLTFPATFFVDSKINNMTLNAVGGAATVEDLTLIGDLDLVVGTLDIASNKLTIENGATVSTAGGFIDATAGSITQKTATLNANALTSNTIKNIEIERAGGVAMSGNLEVTDEFKLTDGTIDIASNTLKLDGTLDYNAGGLDADNGKVDFNNTTEWNLPSTFFVGDIKDLQVSGIGGIELAANAKVTNELNMNGGNITLAPTKTLEVGSSATTAGSIVWNTGTVVGPLKRWFAAATNSSQASGIFPVGTAVLNRYAQVNFTQAPDGGYLVIEFKDGMPTGNNYDTELPIAYTNEQGITSYIQNADESGYWEMTPYNAASEAYEALDNFNYNLALRINNPTSVQNGGVLNNPPGVKLIRAKGYADGSHGNWELAGTYNTFEEITPSMDYVIKSVNVQGFSWFNGGGDNANPLPVELISFNGLCEENQTKLTWQTASEYHSSHYLIEKSTDGNNWRVINNQPAAGNSTQLLKYEFIEENVNKESAYYRLTQVDENGEENDYDPILISCSENEEFIKTFPNPSDNSFQILVNDKNLVGNASIEIVDTKGTIVSRKEMKILEGTNLISVNENLSPGIYYIFMNNGTNSSKIIKHSKI